MFLVCFLFVCLFVSLSNYFITSLHIVAAVRPLRHWCLLFCAPPFSQKSLLLFFFPVSPFLPYNSLVKSETPELTNSEFTESTLEMQWKEDSREESCGSKCKRSREHELHFGLNGRKMLRLFLFSLRMLSFSE